MSHNRSLDFVQKSFGCYNFFPSLSIQSKSHPVLTGSTENPRPCRLMGSRQNIFLTVTLGTEMLMEFLDILAVESLEGDRSPQAHHLTVFLFTHPICRIIGWLGWLYTMTFCRMWQPIHVETWCWATLQSWEWIHSCLLSYGSFFPGRSSVSRQRLQTDFFIVLHNCTQGKGKNGDLECFFFSLQEKHWFKLIRLELTHLRIWRLE